jgi:hypothetical protein
MTTEDSESDIARRLGASLTPRVLRITAQHRGEQSSGLFDIGALYAASVQQVMQRAQAMREPPIRRVAMVAQQPPPWGRVPSAASAATPYATLWAGEEAELELQPAARPKGVGWFGVAVAWLATTAIGAVIATTVPAHALARDRAPTRAPAAAASIVAVAPPPATPSAAVGTPLAVTPAVTTPVAVLRPADAVSLPAPAPEPTPAVAPKKTSAPARPHTSPMTRVASTDLTASASPATAAQAQAAAPVAEAPAPPRVETRVETPAPKAAAPSSPPPAAAGASLEEMMRRAVEADSKHR